MNYNNLTITELTKIKKQLKGKLKALEAKKIISTHSEALSAIKQEMSETINKIHSIDNLLKPQTTTHTSNDELK